VQRIPAVATVVLTTLPLYWFLVEPFTLQQRFGFLFLMTAPALVLQWVVLGSFVMERLNAAGRAYIRMIQAACRGAAMPMVARVGLFDIEALGTTPDDALARLPWSDGGGDAS
jgi:hypothetical protein